MTTLLSNIPLPLRIRILHQDDDLVVVAKPPHLRTVPGNAATTTTTTQPAPKITASQAWKQVVRQYAHTTITTTPKDEIDTFLCHISQVESYAKCLPHKWKPFQSFVQRNWHKYGSDIFQEKNPEMVLPRIFQRLSEAQRRLLPEATKYEESVVGQLILLHPRTTVQNWYIVHRLDCETSGVLVVAKTSTAAASLCRAWRERESVTKLYRARVRAPPATTSDEEEWQTIPDPLKPTERLKWEIAASDDSDAKACLTLWRRRKRTKDCLELKPVTGRTHQLRVHCQAYFGGIVGDTLYGDDDDDTKEERLYLHAYQLSFPHPRTKELVTFVQDPEW